VSDNEAVDRGNGAVRSHPAVTTLGRAVDTRPTVLVVDDEPNTRILVREALEPEGYRVVEAVDGADALRVAQTELPALVLLDMRMPRLDGWGFAVEARRRGHAFAIVAMTAAERAEQWAAEISADGCLAKPFLLDDLYETVERFCAGR
jgi:CheY-like chemotaxis protein